MLEVKDATIAVGGRTLATGLSFIAKDGQMTCITGPEGSGKTVMLRTLMGFLPVVSGFVSVDGELLTVLSAHAFRRMMVYLPQQMQLLTHQMTPPEAVVPEADDYAVWNALLPNAVAVQQPERLGPEDIFRMISETMQGAADRRIIIADEPAALLPPDLSQQMLQLLRRQADAGKTVLIASRRQLLLDHADQVIEIKSE
ncbi:MAG: ATP-binding cassette domain-containing protein [Prevotella sp.]|nr:ATP-binding cassette domain-containing protein [Prevotella sp.]